MSYRRDDMNRLNRTAVHLTLKFGEVELATGTGFPYQHQGNDALITAWHNLSGRNPVTGDCLSVSLAVPDSVVLRFPKLTQEGDRTLLGWEARTATLYDDGDWARPNWTAHPRLAEGIDIAALRVSGWGDTGALHANSAALDLVDFDLEVGGDVFVLGYPRNLQGFGFAPIWKRGSFASDPAYLVQGLPKFVIDAATRKGMSGSPVYARSRDAWLPSGATAVQDMIFGIGWKFVGVYTAREGEDETLAQLGVAWHESAIRELLETAYPSPREAEGPSTADLR